MKGLWLAAGSICLALTTMGPASAGPPSSTTGGIGYVNAGGDDVKLELHAGPGGGGVNYRGSRGVSFKGIVDCYVQAGNMARFTGHITSGNRTGYFRGTTLDNGEPSTHDLVRFGFRAGPYDCARPYAPLRSVLTGNLQVRGNSTIAGAMPTGVEEVFADEEE